MQQAAQDCCQVWLASNRLGLSFTRFVLLAEAFYLMTRSCLFHLFDYAALLYYCAILRRHLISTSLVEHCYARFTSRRHFYLLVGDCM